jgi:hypothetical protein
MNLSNRIFFFFTIIALIIGCKKEEPLSPNEQASPPTSSNVDAFGNPINFKTPAFSALINGDLFEAKSVRGFKTANLMAINGRDGLDSFSITTNNIVPGVYFTKDDGLNSINYFSAATFGSYSSAFLSNSNAKVQITKYDPMTRMVDGIFSGQVWDAMNDDTLQITQGKFKNVKLTEMPFQPIGKMEADIDKNKFISYHCIYRDSTGFYQIVGSNTGYSQSISFQFDTTLKKKAYSVSTATNSEIEVYYMKNILGPNSSSYEGEKGMVNITTINSEMIKGNFQFTAFDFNGDSVVVKNGMFEAVRLPF